MFMLIIIWLIFLSKGSYKKSATNDPNDGVKDALNHGHLSNGT